MIQIEFLSFSLILRLSQLLIDRFESFKVHLYTKFISIKFCRIRKSNYLWSMWLFCQSNFLFRMLQFWLSKKITNHSGNSKLPILHWIPKFLQHSFMFLVPNFCLFRPLLFLFFVLLSPYITFLSPLPKLFSSFNHLFLFFNS